jgi:magnesium transporter
MNLINGLEEKSWGFVLALMLSVFVSGICWWILRHKRLV